MQKGDPLTAQIEAVIQTASIHVAIFSPKYAESEWCMNELHLMVESRRPIIPVFDGYGHDLYRSKAPISAQVLS